MRGGEDFPADERVSERLSASERWHDCGSAATIGVNGHPLFSSRGSVLYTQVSVCSKSRSDGIGYPLRARFFAVRSLPSRTGIRLATEWRGRTLSAMSVSNLRRRHRNQRTMGYVEDFGNETALRQKYSKGHVKKVAASPALEHC